MEIIKKEFFIIDNFVFNEFEEREGGIKVAAFSVHLNGESKMYTGLVANTIISSMKLWRTFRNEENEDDYNFCLTFHYDGEFWRPKLSGIISELNDISKYVIDILKEFGIAEEFIEHEDVVYF